MGLGEQGVTVVPEAPRRWLPGKKWAFITFFIIVALLLFFGFYENPITGKANPKDKIKYWTSKILFSYLD